MEIRLNLFMRIKIDILNGTCIGISEVRRSKNVIKECIQFIGFFEFQCSSGDDGLSNAIGNDN